MMVAVASEQELITRIRADRGKGIRDLGSHVRDRIAGFGSVHLDTALRREAFAELTAPFEVSPFRLVINPATSFVEHNDETVTIDAVLVNQTAAGHVAAVARVIRTYCFREARVHHDLLTVLPDWRNRAIAPRLILASFNRYDELDMRAVTVHASLGAGRWYWAEKVGFDFLNEIERRHVERWATFVLGTLRSQLDLDGLDTPQQWALIGSNLDDQPLASFSSLSRRAQTASCVLLDPSGCGIVGLCPIAEVEGEPGMVVLRRHLRKVAKDNNVAWTAEIPLGKLIMLSGPDWWGTFDLTDPVIRASFSEGVQRSFERAQRAST